MPAMVTAHSNPFNLLVGAITSPKKVVLVNNIIEVKQTVPIKLGKLSRLQCDDGLSGVTV